MSVQLLRGIAAFLVMMFHSVGGDTLYLAKDNIVRRVFDNGWMGVEIFFIISGFIIPYSMYKNNYHIRDIKVFFFKRVVRIEPPYIISIALVLFLNWSNTWTAWYQGPAFHIDWWNVLGHIGYINAFTGQPWLNAPYWTLAIEFEYYLLLACLFPLLMSGNKALRWLLLLLFIIPPFFPLSDAHIPYQLPYFTLGILLFLFTTGTIDAKEFFIFTLATFAVLVLKRYNPILLSLCVLTIICIRYIKRVPGYLLFLGTISYSLYLTHAFTIPRAMGLLGRFTPGMPMAFRIFTAICLGVFLAWLFYYLFERPFQAVSKRIYYKPSAAPQAIAPVVAPGDVDDKK